MSIILPQCRFKMRIVLGFMNYKALIKATKLDVFVQFNRAIQSSLSGDYNFWWGWYFNYPM